MHFLPNRLTYTLDNRLTVINLSNLEDLGYSFKHTNLLSLSYQEIKFYFQ